MFTQIKFHDFHTITQFFHHCSQTNNLRSVQKFHAHLLTSGFFFISPNLQSQLILTYTKCMNKNIPQFLTHFFKSLSPKNPLPFNSIISHFSQHGFDHCALHTFAFMHYNGVYVDSYALCSSLKSASCNVSFGKMMHAYVEKSGWLASVFVGSALVDFHSKLLCMNDAAKVFDEIPVKNTVCVNALMSGYAEAKMWDQVIKLVKMMPLLNLNVDNFTLSSSLRAITGLCNVELGKQVHANVIRNVTNFGHDKFLQSLLIEMYGKCGLVESAKNVFNMAGYKGAKTRQRDVVLWTSILGVYGKIGNYIEVIRLFKHMLMEGIKPDGVAFLPVISACSHTGQVDLGVEYFNSMSNDYGLVASQEHYSCVVDLFCRAGELDRAFKFVSEMLDLGGVRCCQVSMWGALLSACIECGDVNKGKMVAKKALELERDNVGIYVLLSNMYARNGMWGEIEQLREMMRERRLKKDIAWSWIDGASSTTQGHLYDKEKIEIAI